MDAQYSHQNYCLANTQKYNSRTDKKSSPVERLVDLLPKIEEKSDD